MNKVILVIDDDPDLGVLIQKVLQSNDLIIEQALNGHDGLKKSYQLNPDLIILDVMMPDLDGYDVCLRLREMTNIPIMMLTACNREFEVLHGFNVGVDDYIKKPFVTKELQARVKALLRRSATYCESSAVANYKDEFLSVNLENQMVELDGNLIELSSTEYALLACLVRNVGKTVSHHQLVQEVWGSASGGAASTLAIYVFYLRKKLEDSQHGHQYIHTQWGRGYIFLPRER